MFNITLENEIQRGDVKLIQDGSNIKMTIGEDKYTLKDDIKYINYFCKRLKDFEYNNILILGLGLGIIPYYIENNTNITDIDVVEINQNVIDVTSSLNHLKLTNIIHHDCFKYKTNKIYDLIIVDIWWDYMTHMIFDEKNFTNILCNILFTNLKKNINNEGSMYIPLLDKIIYL